MGAPSGRILFLLLLLLLEREVGDDIECDTTLGGINWYKKSNSEESGLGMFRLTCLMRIFSSTVFGPDERKRKKESFDLLLCCCYQKESQSVLECNFFVAIGQQKKKKKNQQL